jgi:cytochrome P450
VFRNFEDDIGLLAVGFIPSIIARKGYEARGIMTQAFLSYYNAGLDKNATGLVQGRTRAARKWGLTTKDICKTEIAILTASVTNTVPDIFYMICYIFSDLDLLSHLRKEISAIVTQGGGLDRLALDYTKVETHCPLLVSCYYETLRLNKTGSLLRGVLSDTILNDQYLLKKGSFIQIATGHIHLDPNNWGPDSQNFNPERFLARESRERNKIQGQAFLPFGGGRNLCPGRHLAFTEITSFVAMLVYGFDISMSDASVLKIPERRFHKMAVASRSPKEDIDVVIRRRKEFQRAVWEFTASS